jgi:hypothetical protein
MACCAFGQEDKTTFQHAFDQVQDHPGGWAIVGLADFKSRQ